MLSLYLRTRLTAHLISCRCLSGLVFVHPLTFRFVVGPLTAVAKRQGNYKPGVREILGSDAREGFAPGSRHFEVGRPRSPEMLTVLLLS